MGKTNYLYDMNKTDPLSVGSLRGRHTVLSEPLFTSSNDKEPLSDIFYNNISHELRTPLNVVLGSIQLFDMMGEELFQSYNRNKFKSYNNLMKTNCFRLLRVINNLIDSSKLDTGNFSLCLANHNIVVTLKEIVNNAKTYAEEKGLRIKLKSKSKEMITAFDEDKLSRAILNLISNALKFTPKGGSVSVEIKRKHELIYISIKDTGIGIPDDKIDSIFDRFVQVDSSLSRPHEGSGLGLSIADSIVKLHGGKISVKSRLGKGSTFTIELPVKIIEEDETQIKLGKDFNQATENVKIELADIS